MNKLKHFISILFCTFVILTSCTTTKSTPQDPCLEYNQGMRVTSNREWPDAVDRAKGIGEDMRLTVLSIRREGPDAYDRLAEQHKAALSPAIRNAGGCYQGSLFQSIVIRTTERFAAIDDAAHEARQAWLEAETRRIEREQEFEELPDETRIHRFGDVEVEVLSVRSRRFTNIDLLMTNRSIGRIIKPVTGRIFGFEDGSDIGGVRAVGFELIDDFGNRIGLRDADPEITFGTGGGMHPGESRKFSLVFDGYPVKSSQKVTIVISRGTFGNSQPYSILLPRDVFLP